MVTIVLNTVSSELSNIKSLPNYDLSTFFRKLLTFFFEWIDKFTMLLIVVSIIAIIVLSILINSNTTEQQKQLQYKDNLKTTIYILITGLLAKPIILEIVKFLGVK